MTLSRFLVVTVAVIGLRATAQNAPPDLILLNGKVVTVDQRFTVASAVAIRDGRIVAVGEGDTIARDRDAKTTVVDLKGATVIPGLIDSHVHPGA
ncbi:MAG TPA: hypothetical protein VK986_19390, partial [Tepidisphaeraceae bacterium]|nr:hypothetical protein [Tepidisphaeraceae bacterium]